jgi:hypothetical protein
MAALRDHHGSNLTGIWNGLYTYPDGRSTSFVATLIENGAALSGTTHEPNWLSRPRGTTLYANICGSRHGNTVTFTKTYDSSEVALSKPIVYEGTLRGDGTEIEGRWLIASFWSGKFLMIRPAGKAAKIARKAFERA